MACAKYQDEKLRNLPCKRGCLTMFGLSKKSWVCFAISAAIICFASTVSSNGPAPTPMESAEKPKQQNANPQKKPTPDQPSADQLPLVIKAPPPVSNERPPAAKNEERESDAAHWLWKQWVEHWPEILLAFFTLGLWMATAQLVRGSERTAKRQLRAYVGVERAPVEPQVGAIKIALEIKNTGQTPAYQVITWANMSKFSPPQVPAFPVYDGSNRYAVIGAMGGITTGITME